MARRSSPCTQADLTRLIKAALAAGVSVDRIAGVKLTRDGAVLLFGEQKPVVVEETAPKSADSSWDDVDAA